MITSRLLVLAVALTAVAGCSNGTGEPAAARTTPPPTTAAPAPGVDVNVVEFSLVPSVSTMPAGAITFRVHNAGTVQHELVLMRTDNPLARLPLETNESKAVEDGHGDKDVGEVEEVDPGTVKPGTFTLAAGHYVLLCNIVTHYASGMRAAFTVT